jgi:hypothetical protein
VVLSSNVRLVFAGDVEPGATGIPDVSEPFSGAVVTGTINYTTSDTGHPWGWGGVRYRYLQFYAGGWYNVGFA